MVAGRYLMDPSPIPRWDVPKLDDADNLFVFAAGREARIYAVPPHTDVEPLAFEDREFQVERFPGQSCHACGSADTYLTEVETDDVTDFTPVTTPRSAASDRMTTSRKFTTSTATVWTGGREPPIRTTKPEVRTNEHTGGRRPDQSLRRRL